MKRALIIAGWIFFTFSPKFGMQKSVVFDSQNDCLASQGIVQLLMLGAPVDSGQPHIERHAYVSGCLQGS